MHINDMVRQAIYIGTNFSPIQETSDYKVFDYQDKIFIDMDTSWLIMSSGMFWNDPNLNAHTVTDEFHDFIQMHDLRAMVHDAVIDQRGDQRIMWFEPEVFMLFKLTFL